MIFEIIIYCQIMRSQRSLRLNESGNCRKKESNSPTLASSFSEKRLWTKSYKNEPFPKELRRIIIGHKLKFSDFSDEEEDNGAVVYEQQESQILEKKKVLPKFKIISDRGEFLATRSRIKSQCKFDISSRRPKSVESLKLPQVMEQKKQQDELQKLERSKLSQFKDKNEFNQCSARNFDNNSNTDNSRQSLQPNHFPSPMPEKIMESIEIEAEETKYQRNRGDRSIIQQISKLIVDQVDDRKRKKEDSQIGIQEIIEEERAEEEIDNINKLRISLDKWEHQNNYMNRLKHTELILSRNNSSNNSECQDNTSLEKKRSYAKNETINESQHLD